MWQHLEEAVRNTFSINVALIVGLVSLLYYYINTKGIPPGPTGIPYFGYLPFLDKDKCHLQLTEFGRKYGDLFSFTITGRLYLNLGSTKVAREALVTNSDCFSERVDSFHIFRRFLEGGVIYLKGEGWRIVRKSFLQLFRERGMNAIKESLSGPIYDTIRSTVEELKKSKGEPVNIAPIILSKCNKVMRETLLGSDGMTEKEMREFNEHYAYTLNVLTSTNALLVGNFARFFMVPFRKEYQDAKKADVFIRNMLKRIIKKRKDTFDENHIRDCIDGFFKERIIRERKNDPTAKYFTDHILLVSLIQIIGDGVHFTSLFISNFLQALLEHPEEQEKIYQELIDVVGMDRDPEMDDKSKLTYTNAFISEVMRTTDLVTMFPSVECTKETTVAGYRIPKGAIILYNFWSAHMNPKDYEEPEKFNPSRFIQKDGRKKAELLPLFGMGKRSCMGEGFAMMQAFLTLTTIVKHYRLTKPVGEKEGDNQFFNIQKINVCAELRK